MALASKTDVQAPPHIGLVGKQFTMQQSSYELDYEVVCMIK
jgi:hypothetical protein